MRQLDHTAISPSIPQLPFFSSLLGKARYELNVEGRLDLPVSNETEGERIETRLSSVALVPCLSLGAGRICALVAAGAFSARGVDQPSARTRTEPHVFGGARVGLSIPVADAWFLRSDIDLALNLTRNVIALGSREVWSHPPLTGAVGAVVGRALP